MQSTRFGLIRHSITRWNEQKRIQGLQDTRLTKTGRRMATAWGHELQDLPWNRILASDLGRVQETVALLNQQLNLPVHLEPLLREQNWGAWSGLSFPELFINQKDEIDKQVAAGWDFRPPDGESRSEVLARGSKALGKAAEKWPEENILVICHEGIIKTLLYHLLDRKFLPDEAKVLKGYQLHLMTINDQTLSLQSLNHLSLAGKDI